VRPGTGRETGLGHAGSDLLKLPQSLAFAYAVNDDVLQTGVMPKEQNILDFALYFYEVMP
jgi:hypothetical protein